MGWLGLMYPLACLMNPGEKGDKQAQNYFIGNKHLILKPPFTWFVCSFSCMILIYDSEFKIKNE